MAARKPRTREEFLDVHGVGQRKLEEYGECFLAEIAEDAIAASSEPLNVCKLSENNIRTSIEAVHCATRCIGDAIHRRKGDNRLLYVIPE